MIVLVLKLLSIGLFGWGVRLFIKYKSHPPMKYVIAIFLLLILNDFVIYKIEPERSWLGKIPSKIIEKQNLI